MAAKFYEVRDSNLFGDFSILLLEAARPDKKQLERLKKYGASRDAGKKFAKTAKLKKRKVKTLKGPS